jgi:hypothetical protein
MRLSNLIKTTHQMGQDRMLADSIVYIWQLMCKWIRVVDNTD